MPRTKEQYADMRQATREKIQKAAGRVFAYKGLTGASVQEIADLAGISTGLMYRHYKSKEELFAEMVEFALDGLVELTKLFESDTPPREIVESVTAEILEDLARDDEFANLTIFMTQAYLGGENTCGVDRLIEQDHRMIAAFEGLIRRGQEQGVFRPGNPAEMAVLYFSAVQGLSVFRAALRPSFTPPSLSMFTAYLFA